MYLTQKHFDFCDKIGVMEMTQTPEHAHQKLVEAIRNEKGVDPKFVQAVENAKVLPSNVSYAVIYRYSVDVEYVVNGVIKNGHIADYGNNGTPSGLDVTSFYKDGRYTSYADIGPKKFELYNDHNLFSLEELKNALKKVIDKRLPSNYTYFKSTNWNAIAYLVPIYTIIIKFEDGKEYQLHYNLHNMKYVWEWPWDPALNKRAKVAGLIQFGLYALGVILPLIAVLAGFIGRKEPAPVTISIGVVGVVVDLIIGIKKHKKKYELQDYFHEHPTHNAFQGAAKALIPAILGLVLMILAFASINIKA